MIALARLARVELELIVAFLFLTIVWLTLTGKISLAGLLQNKQTGEFDPGRLQLLTLTLLTATTMLTQLDHMQKVRELALPSNGLLYALGGSQVFYLFRKRKQSRPEVKGE